MFADDLKQMAISAVSYLSNKNLVLGKILKLWKVSCSRRTASLIHHFNFWSGYSWPTAHPIPTEPTPEILARKESENSTSDEVHLCFSLCPS